MLFHFYDINDPQMAPWQMMHRPNELSMRDCSTS
jgi:hypothetical protein